MAKIEDKNYEAKLNHLTYLCDSNVDSVSNLHTYEKSKLDLKVSLKRRLTLLNSISLIAGSIIGSGIFVSPKSVLQHSGTPAFALLIWFLCGIFSFFGAMCYVELGLTIPKSGSQYIYVMEAFGALPSFLILWIDLILKEPIAKSVTSMAVAKYLIESYFDNTDMINNAHKPYCEMLIAICTLSLLTYINAMSVKCGLRIQDSFFYTKLIALTMIIFIGLLHLSNGNRETLKQGLYLKPESAVNISLAFYAGLFAYAGWEALNVSCEEVKNLKKNLPAAMYISLGIVTVVYTLTNISYFAVLSGTTIMSSNIVAVTFIKHTLPALRYIMPILVTTSIIGSLNSTIFHSGRMYFSAAREGHLPPLFGMLSITSMTPIPALLLDCVTSIIVLIFMGNNLNLMLEFYGFLRSAALASGVLALLWLRYKRPMLMRPKKFPIIFPLIFLAMSIFMTFVPLYKHYFMGIYTLILLLVGILVYYLFIVQRTPLPKPPAKSNNAEFAQRVKDATSQVPPSADLSTDAKMATNGIFPTMNGLLQNVFGGRFSHAFTQSCSSSSASSGSHRRRQSAGYSSPGEESESAVLNPNTVLGRCMINVTSVSQKILKVIPCEIEPDYEKLLLEMSR